MLLVLLCAAAVWTAGCRDQSSDTPTAGPVSPTPTATALPVSAAPPTPTAGPVSPTPTATALSVSAAPTPNVVPASPTPAPDDNEPPTITSGLPSGWVYYPDHRTGWVSDYDATDPDGDDITWSLEGNDRHAFRIDSSGVLIFRSSPEHYNPTDSDQDNVYNLVVVATDNGTPSKSAKREVNISVFTVLGHEEYPCGPFGIGGIELLKDSLGPFANDQREVVKWLDEPQFLQWVPGASLLVFDFDQDIWAVSTDGAELRRIVDPSSPRGALAMYGFGANVSPDGSRIVYSSCEFPIGDLPSRHIVYGGGFLLGTGYEIGVIDIDGTGQVRLTKNGDFDSLPVWSPDGTQIAFVAHNTMFFFAQHGQIWHLRCPRTDREGSEYSGNRSCPTGNYSLVRPTTRRHGLPTDKPWQSLRYRVTDPGIRSCLRSARTVRTRASSRKLEASRARRRGLPTGSTWPLR